MDKITTFFTSIATQPVQALIDRVGTTPIAFGVVAWKLGVMVEEGKIDPLYGAGGLVVSLIAFIVGRHFERAQKIGGTPPPTTPST